MRAKSDRLLDAQTALAWHYTDEATAATDALLEQFNEGKAALVSTIFHYEVANCLVGNERRKVPRSSPAKSAAFLGALAQLPIETDEESTARTATQTAELARTHGLSVYDASYLELAMRKNVPLATRDPQLVRAAKKVGVRLLL